MSPNPALTEEQDQHLREMTQHVRALDAYPPAELADLYASPALEDYARRVVRAVAALQLSFTPDETGALQPDIVADRIVAEVKYSGPAHKVSVSMPADLTACVQQRVGRGKFSQYVAAAVSRQLELDMLAELSELLAAEHGPVPEEYLAEARAAWPDGE
jgi:hypothetical protein